MAAGPVRRLTPHYTTVVTDALGHAYAVPQEKPTIFRLE